MGIFLTLGILGVAVPAEAVPIRGNTPWSVLLCKFQDQRDFASKCQTNYVWRQADLLDYVCVTEATRRQVAEDNAAKVSRWVVGAYGSHTCKSGYVWREAFVGDDVCVTTSQRTQAANDNKAAASRIAQKYDMDYFIKFFTQANTDGVAGYLADQSGGLISLSGSAVRGWYTLPYTAAQMMFPPTQRGPRAQHCIDAAKKGGYSVPSNHRIIVIFSHIIDNGAEDARVTLDYNGWNVGTAAHEMLHVYGLGHGFSDDTTYRNACWAKAGEYDDPWDVMGNQGAYSFKTSIFGDSGVGLGGYQRDKLGWLPRNRVFTMGADGVASRTLSLAPLEAPSASSGPLLVRVPFEPADPFRYYTVEYRRKVNWGKGFHEEKQVLIREVKYGTPYLLRTGPKGGPIASLNKNDVQIRINSMTDTAASVTITTNIVQRCLVGYVWREARDSDRVCVTPATRAQVAADNAVKASRWVVGAYGAHTCKSGYVWREAFPGDDVCVTTSQRTQAANDNKAAASRVNPAQNVFGPNTCKVGYVWREADLSDYVCVTPATRTQVAADNAAKASRWVVGAYGVHTCKSGYVWREAFIGDDVCVTTSQRTLAANDNNAAASRVMPSPVAPASPPLDCSRCRSDCYPSCCPPVCCPP